MDFVSIVFSLASGFAAGLTGALPFVHTNSVLAFFDAGSFASPVAASVFAAALCFSHLAFETLPSLFLALPSQNQSVAALPGQRLVLSGRGAAALFLIARSLFLALAASVVLAPLALFVLPLAFAAAKPFAGFVLALIVFVALAREKNAFRVLTGVFVFVLSGAVGFAALSLPVAREPLFPLLAGLFGVPAILFSFGAKPLRLAAEKSVSPDLPPPDWRLILAGVAVGGASVLFPALSPALLAGAFFFFLEGDAERFLEASSAVVASKTFFDFVGVFAISRARSGAAAFVLNAFESASQASASLADFALVCVAAFASLAAALALLLVFRRAFARAFERVAGAAFSASLLALVVVASLAFSGWGGVLVLAAAASCGCVAPLLGVKRSFAMGALFVPSMLFFFGADAGVFALFY